MWGVRRARNGDEGGSEEGRSFLSQLALAQKLSSGGCPKAGSLNLCYILGRVPFSGPTALSPLSYPQFCSRGTAP